MNVTHPVLSASEVIDGFVATPCPRLGWSVNSAQAAWEQQRAEIEILRRGSTEVFVFNGARAHAHEWPADPIEPHETVCARVRVAAAAEELGRWSDPLSLHAGFLGEHGWERPFVSSGSAGPFLLRGEVEIERSVERATLFVAAFGAAVPYVNGTRIGDHELAPGWTSYQWRVDHDTYDVTGSLSRGRNRLGLAMHGAWQSERYGFRDSAAQFYDGDVRASAQLHVVYHDGTQVVSGTDGSWMWRDGATVSSGIYQGEVFDARRGSNAGLIADLDHAEAWSPVVVVEEAVTPTPRIAPPVRVTQTLPVVSSHAAESGGVIVDFGQNVVGRIRLTVDAAAGTEITLRHAEVLVDGELATRPLRNAAATDVYICGGGSESWTPAGTFHGFRYAEITGWPAEWDDSAVVAEVLGTDLRRIGGLATSHPLLQRLHDNVVWGARGNFLSVPMDCPQRDERLGWTGDIQVFAPTASFLFDSESFLRSWMRDALSEQAAADGIVPMVVPAVIPQVPGLFEPIAAWGDAVTVVPWALYRASGDDTAIREAYSGMKSWVETVRRRANGFLWEDGRQYGDWLDPDAPADQPGRAKTDPDIVATAYFHRSARLTADAAELLGRLDEAREYRALADDIRGAFQRTYLTPSGRMMSDAPTAYALAIVFELVDEAMQMTLGDRLAELVRRRGFHISTGFAGTPIINDALTLTGHLAVADRLLMQEENPSWLYPVTMGATTVWERWDSLLEDGSLNPGQMTSFNHFALGSVADWLHRVPGGIVMVEPGYRRFRFEPQVLAGVEDIAVWHDSPYGRIDGAWRRENGVVHYSLVVPPNTRARVVLPGVQPSEVGSGRHTWQLPDAMTSPDSSVRLSIDGPMTKIVENPRAYREVMDALSDWDEERAHALRRAISWTEGRRLRDPLDKVPVHVMDEIEERLQRTGVTVGR